MLMLRLSSLPSLAPLALSPPPQATRPGPPPDDRSFSHLRSESHSRSALSHKNKHHFENSFVVSSASSSLSSASAFAASSSRAVRLCPAKAASAEASTTSLYDRLGGDAIKLVTSMLFDK